MNKPLVNVEGLRVEFPSKRGAIAGVQDVSFTIEPGEIVCIVGESGSGKSVSAYTLMQLTKFSGGWVADGRLTLESGNGSEIDLRAADEARMRTIRGKATSTAAAAMVQKAINIVASKKKPCGNIAIR